MGSMTVMLRLGEHFLIRFCARWSCWLDRRVAFHDRLAVRTRPDRPRSSRPVIDGSQLDNGVSRTIAPGVAQMTTGALSSARKSCSACRIGFGTAVLGTYAANIRREAAMRTYLKAAAIMAGLLGTWATLLPLVA